MLLSRMSRHCARRYRIGANRMRRRRFHLRSGSRVQGQNPEENNYSTGSLNNVLPTHPLIPLSKEQSASIERNFHLSLGLANSVPPHASPTVPNLEEIHDDLGGPPYGSYQPTPTTFNLGMGLLARTFFGYFIITLFVNAVNDQAIPIR